MISPEKSRQERAASVRTIGAGINWSQGTEQRKSFDRDQNLQLFGADCLHLNEFLVECGNSASF
jgi:hypothetical protein